MTIKANRIERYYDSHRWDDEELGQSIFHQMAIEYLFLILRWLFREKQFGITTNVNFYVTDDPLEPGISPDVAVVAGLKDSERQPDEPYSYYVGQDGPPPTVVFEMSSEKTWQQDLLEKPARYAQMGIKEYFAFDPHERGVWTKGWRKQGRLLGWRLKTAGEYEELTKNEQGWLWSKELDSWLVVDGQYLRLYQSSGERRLTGEEAERQEKEQVLHLAIIERQRAERLAQKLRELGQNPDDL